MRIVSSSNHHRVKAVEVTHSLSCGDYQIGGMIRRFQIASRYFLLVDVFGEAKALHPEVLVAPDTHRLMTGLFHSLSHT